MEEDKPKTAVDKYVPPPMDPYATYQTPYERRPSNDQNPFIEFRRFTDRHLSSMFEGFPSFPSIFGFSGFSDEVQKMREQSEKFEAHLQKQIQDVAEHNRKMLEDSWKDHKDIAAEFAKFGNALASSAIVAEPPVQPADSTTPTGWVRADTRDGKVYYIEQATGKASLGLPTQEEVSHSSGYGSRHVTSGGSDLINHEAQATAWGDIISAQEALSLREMLVEQAEAKQRLLREQEKETQRLREHEEGGQRWTRNFRGYPELKKHGDETELAMYEDLDEGQAVEEQSWEKTWQRGYQNCPELRQYKDMATSATPDVSSAMQSIEDQEVEAAWQRGFRNCPALAPRHDSELGLYARSNDTLNDRREDWEQVWQRGVQNCPELKQEDTDGAARIIDLITAATMRANSSNMETVNEKSKIQVKSRRSWLPELGYDGIQKAKKAALHAKDRDRLLDLKECPFAFTSSEDIDLTSSNQDNHIPPSLEFSPSSLKVFPHAFRNHTDQKEGLNVPTSWEEHAVNASENLQRTIQEAIHNDDDVEYDDDEGDDIQNYLLKLAQLQQNLKESPSNRPFPRDPELTPSVVSTMTRTISRTRPDGSVETKRVLRKRFTDGREEAEETTDISQPSQTEALRLESIPHQTNDNASRKTGWFWN